VKVLTRGHLDVPLVERSSEHLHHARDRVASGLEVAVVRRAEEEDEKPKRHSHCGGPEAPDPHALVLVERQEGVGEEGADVERHVEVAEEGKLGAPLRGVRLVELVGPERRHRRLVPADPERSRVG